MEQTRINHTLFIINVGTLFIDADQSFIENSNFIENVLQTGENMIIAPNSGEIHCKIPLIPALQIHTGSAFISSCSFKENHGVRAISVDRSASVTISNSALTNKREINSVKYCSGTLYASGSSDVSIFSSNLTNNRAIQGSAVYADNSYLMLRDVELSGLQRTTEQGLVHYKLTRPLR